MADLLLYPIKVSVCMLLLYALYVLALRRDTHFRFNRFYLLFSLTVSLIIPIINIQYNYTNAEAGISTLILQTFQIGAFTVSTAKNSLSSADLLIIIYLTGCIFLLIRFLTRLFSLMLIRRKCKIVNNNGYNIALCNKPVAPFSFFYTIFIDKKAINDEQMDKIMLHESVHIHQLHSLDIVFAEAICMFTWFNPVSWMIKAALKETHEYLADSEVTKETSTSAEYFQLLARFVVGMQPHLANNFNKSLTLKRLNMMKKSRSGRLSLLKALPVFPVVLILFIVFSCSNNTYKLKSQNPSVNQEEQKMIATVMPEYPGGQSALTKYLMENVKYPDIARTNGTEGIVYVAFVVTKTGKLEKVLARHKVNDLLDAEAIRVVSAMPDWIPGKDKDKNVDVELTLPISFKLK